MGLEFEFRALHLESRHSYHLSCASSHFALVILGVESWELFTGAELELQSSQSQFPK
jgi:hypothetical protein